MARGKKVEDSKPTADISIIQKNKENYLLYLEKNMGIKTKACVESGLSVKLINKYIKEDIEFKQKCEEVKEICLDFAEDQLFQLIKDKNKEAILFYLKSQGKTRGYTDTGDDGKMQIMVNFNNSSKSAETEPIKINISQPPKNIEGGEK